MYVECMKLSGNIEVKPTQLKFYKDKAITS